MSFGLAKEGQQKLPAQKTLKSTCLKPGRKVDLVLSAGKDPAPVDVRSTMLYDLDKRSRLLLAQTSPKVDAANSGRKMEVTFLAKFQDVPGGRWLRVGYQTPLVDVKDNYQVGPAAREEVLLVGAPKKLVSKTLRLDDRLEPPPDQNLKLFIMPDRTLVQITDISLGGVRFTHPLAWHFKPQNTISLSLGGGETEFRIEAQVVRSGDIQLSNGQTSGMTAVRFEGVSPIQRQKLADLLRNVSNSNQTA